MTNITLFVMLASRYTENQTFCI